MTTQETAAIKARIADWKRAMPAMEEQRCAEIRAADTGSMIRCSNLLFRDALKHFPPGPHSGLVQQQYWFSKLRTA